MKKFVLCISIIFLLHQLTAQKNSYNSLLPIYISHNYNIEQKNIDLIIQGKVSLELAKKFGFTINSTIGDIATVTIPSDKLEIFLQQKELIFYPNKLDAPLLDESTSASMNGVVYRGIDADRVQNFGSGGSGVIVAVLDYYPLNWKHEDFSVTGWDSDDLRVISIWNQTDNSGIPPAGFGYGTEYSKQNLRDDLGPIINSSSHGTGCTGIATGDGSGSGVTYPLKGIADNSEIIYVHKKSGSSNTIDAITYFQAKADELNKPIVLSFSGGTYHGYPDGSDPVSTAINNFCENGRLAAVAGGNYYNLSSNHAFGNSTLGNPTTDLTFQIDSFSNTGPDEFSDFLDVIIYYKSPDNFDITVTTPSDETFIAEIGESVYFDTVDGRLYISHNEGDIEIVITDLSGTILVGDIWNIQISVPSDEYDDLGGNWNTWLYEKNITGTFTNYSTSDYTMNIYACAEESIGVAAHSKTSGNLYSGSSAGFSLDGRIKPDISAPTSAITTSNTNTTSYGSLGGTSGATPHVAGTLALILEQNSNISPTDARNLIIDSAFTDTVTGSYGTIPNKRVGYGKLNALRSIYPKLPQLENVLCEVTESETSVKISWENLGFKYRIYGSADNEAIFPAGWILEGEVSDQAEVILPITSDKRFYRITAD